jgi:hypothetical protein
VTEGLGGGGLRIESAEYRDEPMVPSSPRSGADAAHVARSRKRMRTPATSDADGATPRRRSSNAVDAATENAIHATAKSGNANAPSDLHTARNSVMTFRRQEDAELLRRSPRAARRAL